MAFPLLPPVSAIGWFSYVLACMLAVVGPCMRRDRRAGNLSLVVSAAAMARGITLRARSVEAWTWCGRFVALPIGNTLPAINRTCRHPIVAKAGPDTGMLGASTLGASTPNSFGALGFAAIGLDRLQASARRGPIPFVGVSESPWTNTPRR